MRGLVRTGGAPPLSKGWMGWMDALLRPIFFSSPLSLILSLTSSEQKGWSNNRSRPAPTARRDPVRLACFFRILTRPVYASMDQCVSMRSSPCRSTAARYARPASTLSIVPSVPPRPPLLERPRASAAASLTAWRRMTASSSFSMKVSLNY